MSNKKLDSEVLKEVRASKSANFSEAIKAELTRKMKERLDVEKMKLGETVFKESVETPGHGDMVIDAISSLDIKKKAAPDAQDESDEQDIDIQKTMADHMTEEKVCEVCGAPCMDEDVLCKNCK